MLKIVTLCEAVPGQVDWRQIPKGQEQQESGWLIKCYISPFRNLLRNNSCATHQKEVTNTSKCQEAVPKRQIKVMLNVMPDFEIREREHLISDISGLFEVLVPMMWPTFCPRELRDQQSVSALIFYWETRGNVIQHFNSDHMKSPNSQCLHSALQMDSFSALRVDLNKWLWQELEKTTHKEQSGLERGRCALSSTAHVPF